MRAAILVLLGGILTACSADSPAPLVATDIVISQPMSGNNMSAGYLALTNNSDHTVNISAVRSREFAVVEMHESILEDGVAKMRRIELLTIPAHSTVTFERGGKHLMLMQPGKEFDTVSLSFYAADVLLLDIDAPLKPRAR